MVPDVQNCDFISEGEDLEVHLGGGIRAVQTTPLVSRSGALLGMVSTHWREPHEPSVSKLRALDILARLAADEIERARADDHLQRALEQLQFVTENMSCGVTRCSRDLRYLWVSRTYAAWLGLTPEKIAGRAILDVIGHEGYEGIRPHVEKVLSGKKEEYESNASEALGEQDGVIRVTTRCVKVGPNRRR